MSSIPVVSIGYDVGHQPSTSGSVGIPTDRVVGALADLADRVARPASAPVELALLATCNRTELYTAGLPAAVVEDLFARFFTHCPAEMRPTEAPTVRTGADAAAHLFAVAAGMRSVVLGESEILGQIRRAAKTAAACGTFGTTLRSLFDHAVRTGRDIRSRTSISTGAVGLGAVVAALVDGALVDGALVDDAVGPGQRRPRVVLIGAGATAWAIGRELAYRDRSPDLVLNRTVDQAARLAVELGSDHGAVDGDLPGTLRADDVVVVAVACGALLAWEDLPPVRMVIDVGRPAAVTGAPVGAVIDLEEVQRRRAAGVATRERALPQATHLVHEATRLWSVNHHAHDVDQVISQLMADIDGMARSHAPSDEQGFINLRRTLRQAVHPHLSAIRRRNDGAVELGRKAALVALEGTS